MGGGNSKQRMRTEFELRQFSNQTNLLYEEVAFLYSLFQKISASQKDDGVIDFNQFCKWMNIQKDQSSGSLFSVFDLNNDQVLNFRQFVLGISNLINPQLEFTIKYSFSLIDRERKKIISSHQIFRVLISYFQKFSIFVIPEVSLKAMILQDIKQIASLGEETPLIQVKEEDNDIDEWEIIKDIQQDPGDLEQEIHITFDQYREFCLQNPSFVQMFEVELRKFTKNVKVSI